MIRSMLGLLAGFVLGVLLVPGHVAAIGDNDQADPALEELVIVTNMPTETMLSTATPVMTQTPVPTADPNMNQYPGIRIDQPIEVTTNITLGLTGAVQCWNCAPFQPSYNGQPVQVRVSNYTPWAGGINCWQWSDEFKYCMSETRSGLSWEEFYGFSAACPEEWPHGTWVAIDDVGAFICLDTGYEVVCHDGTEAEITAGDPPHCHVDILGPSGDWNQQIKGATLWVSFNPRR